MDLTMSALRDDIVAVVPTVESQSKGSALAAGVDKAPFRGHVAGGDLEGLRRRAATPACIHTGSLNPAYS